MDKPKPKTKAKLKKLAIRQTVNGNEVVAEIYKASDGVVSKGGSVTVRNPHGYEPKAI